VQSVTFFVTSQPIDTIQEILFLRGITSPPLGRTIPFREPCSPDGGLKAAVLVSGRPRREKGPEPARRALLGPVAKAPHRVVLSGPRAYKSAKNR
ncbi:MAG: hypothetical protein M3158_11605, partial [Pseudomonadota bacterium]|nr:hypothetical protein [Pseudomonadota bacterium]